MKKYISPFICGFGAGVLQIVPFVKSFSCCMILPLAVFTSLILDQRATKNFGRIDIKKAALFGLITGLSAAFFGTFFDIVITFITKQSDLIYSFPELQRMIESFPVTSDVKNEVMSLFQSVRNDLLNSGFSWFYTISILANNFIVNTIFGIIGGLVSAQVINRKINSVDGQ